MPSLGSIVGRIKIDVAQAIAAYAAVRAANAKTLYALRGSSTAFIAAGKGMLVAGGLMVYVFGQAVQAAAEFERKMDFFGAVTNTSAEGMQKVSDKALQLGQDTIYSADQIADSFVELGKAGITAEQIIGGVGDAVAHLGASADIPLTTAADIITAAVQTFDLKAQDAVHVADLLQGAANASIVEVEDLGVSLKYVGGIAAATSVPIESVIDALSLLGKAGIKGSTAGTSLRQIMVSLTATSKKATEQLEELGIITKNGTNLFYTKTGAIKPLAKVFQILQNHTKDMGEADRLAAFKIIFNNRALAAANILTREGAKGFAEMNSEISKTTAAEVSAKRLDNLSGDIEILRGNIETLFIKAGGPFQNFMRMIVQGITKMIQAFTALPEGVQTAIFGFLGFGGAALVVMGSISLIVGVVLKFYQTMKLLGMGFGLIRGAIQAVIVGMRLLGLAFLTNPIGIIITAIGLLIVGFILLYQHSETFRNIIANIGKFFVAVWNGIVAFFSDIPGSLAKVWEAIKNAFGAAINWIKENWQKLLVIFGGPLVWIVALVVKFKDQIIGFFKELWNKAVDLVGNLVEGVINFFKELPSRILGILRNLLVAYANYWKWLFTTAINIVKNIVTGVVNFFRQLPGKILFLIGYLIGRAVTLWMTLRDKLVEFTWNLISGIVTFFAELPGKVIAYITDLKDRAIRGFFILKDRAIALAKQIVAGIINFIRTLPQRVVSFFNTMRQRAVQALINLWNNAKSWAGKIRDGFINAIRNLPSLVADVFRNVLSTIGNFVSGLWDKAKEAGSALWEGFKSGLGIASPSYLEKAVFQINKTLEEEVPKMKKHTQKIQTIAEGTGKIKATKGSCCEAATKAASALGGAQARYDKASTSLESVKKKVAAANKKPTALLDTIDKAEINRVAQQMAIARANRPKVPHGALAADMADARWNVQINNPKPEPASTSITRLAAHLTYLGMLND